MRALTDVQLTLYPGEIHALMGENGAGKSTLMKVLSGAYRADPGAEIRIDGKPVSIDGPTAARTQGIAIIYQELALAPNLTVAENIFLGRELRRGVLIDCSGMASGCADVLKRLGAAFGSNSLVGDLSIAERQMVEIARGVHANSRILVMDEPTTALSSRETDALFVLIKQLRAERLAIVYISHRMAEVYGNRPLAHWLQAWGVVDGCGWPAGPAHQCLSRSPSTRRATICAAWPGFPS